MKKIAPALVLLFLLLWAWLYSKKNPSQDTLHASFYTAKKRAKQIFKDHRLTLYCGCVYNASNRVNLASCHMQSAMRISRAHRIEWEHMMPAENFGRHFPCWRHALCHKQSHYFRGRRCCTKIDASFRKAESELYNLWPAVGIINALRSNFRYAALTNHTHTYGCNFTINQLSRKVEPADSAKGIVARANLFMSDHYHIRLSREQRALFNRWNRQFPTTPWEKTWSNRIYQIEGYRNTYIN
jgi:deoxyribonuclease-1